MGYRISSLASLPVIPGKSLYVFVLGQRVWDGGLMEQVEKNFAKIAKQIGPNGAIVLGHEGVSLTFELVDAAGSGPPGFRELLNKGQDGEGAVLVLDAHPKELQPDSLVLYASLDDLESRFGSLSVFFTAICEFAENRTSSFLARFQSGEGPLDRVLEVVDLKPNFFGFGFNINKAIAWLR